MAILNILHWLLGVECRRLAMGYERIPWFGLGPISKEAEMPLLTRVCTHTGHGHVTLFCRFCHNGVASSATISLLPLFAPQR